MSKRLQEWEKQAVLDAYANGEKLSAIAAEFGVAPVSISMLAKRRGLARRPRYHKPTGSNAKSPRDPLAGAFREMEDEREAVNAREPA
jgi:hypothetical protein